MSRIALLAGACIRHDAISNVVRLQEGALVEAGYDVRVFVQHTDFRGGRHVVVRDEPSLHRDAWYRSADLVILHFGIFYRLFDSLGCPHDGVRVLQFHNVTPPELLSGSVRDAVIAGVDQLAEYVNAVDRVWSDSTHNTDSLLELTDVDPSRVTLMPLCVPWAKAPPSTPKGRRVIAVGRLMSAKGQLDLVDAVAALDPEALPGLRVDVVGARRSSDPAYIALLRHRIAEHGLGRVVKVALDPTDDALRALYRAAGVFVSTSRHEGFCVPVIEAIASGCRVVATDVGALPETVGPCGTIVPVGDVDALAGALTSALDAPALDPDELAVRAAHLETYSRESFRRRLLDGVAELLSGRATVPG